MAACSHIIIDALDGNNGILCRNYLFTFQAITFADSDSHKHSNYMSVRTESEKQ